MDASLITRLDFQDAEHWQEILHNNREYHNFIVLSSERQPREGSGPGSLPVMHPRAGAGWGMPSELT